MRKTVILTIVFIVLLATTATAGITYQLTKVSYPIVVNGKNLSTDKPILNYNGSTYLPLRAVGEATGSDVKWDSALGKVFINSKFNKNDLVLLNFYRNLCDLGTYISDIDTPLNSYFNSILYTQYELGTAYNNSKDRIEYCNTIHTRMQEQYNYWPSSFSVYVPMANKVLASTILDSYKECIGSYTQALSGLKLLENDSENENNFNTYFDNASKAGNLVLEKKKDAEQLYNDLYNELTK